MDAPSVEVEFVHVVRWPVRLRHLGNLPLLFWEGFQIALVRIEEVEFFVNGWFPLFHPRFPDELGIERRYVNKGKS